jgi:predicted SAM-dependent methyltransferase
MLEKYLNVGCGDKYTKDLAWTNIDFYAHSPSVIAHNLLTGLPFADNSFSVVYLSQVIEHFSREDGQKLLKECFRVLEPGGIIRLVTPDLENIVKDYLTYLEKCRTDMNEINFLNYEWIMLELLDQSLRNVSTGEMGEYLRRPVLANEQWILDRVGYTAKLFRDKVHSQSINKNSQSANQHQSINENSQEENQASIFTRIKRKIKNILTTDIKGKLKSHLLTEEEKKGLMLLNQGREGILRSFLTADEKKFLEIGRFRLGGEIHYWLYDYISLSKACLDVGFSNWTKESPQTSQIKDWGKYELDVKGGLIYNPVPKNLFLEAKKY